MAVFNFFNVQVLPAVRGSREIGKSGYLKLFGELGSRVRELRRRRIVHQLSYRIGHIFSLSPFEVTLKANYVVGRLIKYDKPDSIRDLYTNDIAMKIAPHQSAHRFEIHFQFDPEIHVLALEKTHLGSARKAEEFLEFLLGPVVHDLFKDHTLTVTTLTSAQDLQELMRTAKGFKRIELNITYSNSDSTISGYAKEIEREMKSNRILDVEHAEKSDPKGLLLRPTKICSALLALVGKYGAASIRYLSPEDKLRTYDTESNPLKERVAKSATETDEEYEKRLYEVTRDANRRSMPRPLR